MREHLGHGVGLSFSFGGFYGKYVVSLSRGGSLSDSYYPEWVSRVLWLAHLLPLFHVGEGEGCIGRWDAAHSGIPISYIPWLGNKGEYQDPWSRATRFSLSLLICPTFGNGNALSRLRGVGAPTNKGGCHEQRPSRSVSDGAQGVITSLSVFILSHIFSLVKCFTSLF